MTNRQVALLCASILIACSGFRYFPKEDSIWGIANKLDVWLEKGKW